MLNYELIRAVQLDRERDMRRAVRERSLRASLVTREDVGQAEARPVSAESGGAPRLAAARPR
jgi:hypothetical protein